MNLSLPVFLASIIGPCLFAFTVGYFSSPLFADTYLPLAINDAFKRSILRTILPSVLFDSSSSDSRNTESPQIIQWKQYLSENVKGYPTEVPLTEQVQNDLTENMKSVATSSQLVLIELQDLDRVFLESKEKVENSLLMFVKGLRIDDFTYDCHQGLSGKGVRCMGYAGKDTISLYTWPDSGALSLNVQSSLRDPWVTIVPLASEIFAVPTASTESNFPKPCLIWSLKKRNTTTQRWMLYKPAKRNPSAKHDTISIDSYEISSNADGVNVEPILQTPEPNNDNRQQNYDMIYHEALVHPVMLAHDNPKRVVIVGNGTGATLREVLKHNTVEKVVLIGSDSPQWGRQLYPQHADCSTLKGVAANCYDDARVEVVAVDTLKWLQGKEGDASLDDQFDVVILEKSDTLLSSKEIFEKTLDGLSNIVSPHGALVIPHGVLERSTEHHVFETALWHETAAEVEVKMQSRLVGPTYWFDGATMMNYQFPSRLVEDSFCSQPETPYMCDEGHGFDPDIPNAPISSFAVGVSRIPGAGRGVFFQKDVAKGTFIAADESVYDMVIYPSTTTLFSEMIEFLDSSEYLHYSSLFYTYIYGYGFAFEYFGKPGYLVDTGILTFINHGCNGTGVMGEGEPILATEMTVDLDRMPPELEEYGTETHIYNPFIDRNNMKIMTAGDVTLFDMKAGSELVDNYLRYLHEGNWKAGVLDYRAQCIASGKGVVTDYEQRKSSSASKGEEFHFHPPLEL